MAKRKAKNMGKQFETDFEQSAEESGYWVFRVRDVNPAALKNRFAIPKNPYDTMIFDGEFLYTLELKSNQGTSITHRGSNPQIKPHQVEALVKASQYENVIAGLILNFRTDDNRTFFIPIDDFVEYDLVTKGKKEDNYKAKINEKSIPLRICEEIGIEVLSVKKRVHYRYFINDLLEQAADNYNRRNVSI